MKFCFIIPYYNEQSNGIRVLYQAALMFSRLRKCYIKIYDRKHNQVIENPNLKLIPQEFHLMISNNHIDTENFIYIMSETPALVPVNLPSNSKLVRYLLANPFFFNNTNVSFNGEYLLAYSGFISNTLPQLFIETIPGIKIKKKSIKCKRKLLIYFGKFRLNNDCNHLNYLNEFIQNYDDVEILHRNYPSTHELFINKISEASLLISYDGMTSVTHEASLLGIPVIMVDELNINESFHSKYKNIFSLTMLARKNKPHEILSGTPYKTSSASSKDTRECINLIESFFLNKKINNKLKLKFKEELKFMKVYAEKKFKDSIVSYDSHKKLFLLLMYYFDRSTYLEIRNKLNLYPRSIKAIILILYLILFRLHFKAIKFFYTYLIFIFFYYISQKRFIMAFNTYMNKNKTHII